MTSSLILFRNVCLRGTTPETRDGAERVAARRDDDAQHPLTLLQAARRTEVTR